MSENNAPSFHIVGRDKGAPSGTPFVKVDEAWTQKQADRKIARWQKAAALEKREVYFVIVHVPNLADRIGDASEDQEEPAAAALAETAAAVAPAAPVVAAPPPPVVAPDRVEAFQKRVTGGGAEASSAETGAPSSAAPVDAITGLTPLPWAKGDILRDKYTGREVCVTHIYQNQNPSGRAFDWETIGAAEKGWCPIKSIGCFEFVSAPIMTPDPVTLEPDPLVEIAVSAGAVAGELAAPAGVETPGAETIAAPSDAGISQSEIQAEPSPSEIAEYTANPPMSTENPVPASAPSYLFPSGKRPVEDPSLAWRNRVAKRREAAAAAAAAPTPEAAAPAAGEPGPSAEPGETAEPAAAPAAAASEESAAPRRAPRSQASKARTAPSHKQPAAPKAKAAATKKKK